MNVLLFTAQLSAGTACGGSCDSGSLVRKADRMASRKQSCGARGGEGRGGETRLPPHIQQHVAKGFFFPAVLEYSLPKRCFLMRWRRKMSSSAAL